MEAVAIATATIKTAIDADRAGIFFQLQVNVWQWALLFIPVAFLNCCLWCVPLRKCGQIGLDSREMAAT